MANLFFSCCIHFGDDRFEIMQRPFLDLDTMHETIISNWNSLVKPDDIVYYLGDTCVTGKEQYLPLVDKLNGEKHLFIGNHDKLDESEYLKYFKTVRKNLLLSVNFESKNYKLFLNHYPTRGSQDYWNVTGHIHGAWRIQKNMVNVCQDAWHYRPVSMKQIVLMMNAVENFYDQDVWCASNPINTKYDSRGKKGSYADKLESK